MTSIGVTKSLLATSSRISAHFEDAVKFTGYGLFNYVAWTSSSLVFVHSILESAEIAYVMTMAECELNLSVAEKGLIVSATFMGIMSTAIFWGIMSDRYGRRMVMLPAVFITIILSLASSFSTSFAVFFTLRLLVGIVVSAGSATVLVYLGETQTDEKRDKAITICLCCSAVYISSKTLVAWAILGGKWSFSLFGMIIKPWRVFMWTWSLPGLVGGILLAILPESPRFVLAVKGYPKSIPILAKMFAWNYRRKAADFPVKRFIDSQTQLVIPTLTIMDSLKETKYMFHPPLWRCTWITHSCMFCVYLLVNGIYMWMPDLMNDVLQKVDGPYSICDIISTKYAADYIAEPESPSKYSKGGCDSVSLSPWLYPLTFFMEASFFLSFLLVIFIINKYKKSRIYGAYMIMCSTNMVVSSVVPQAGVAIMLLTVGLGVTGCMSILTAVAVDVFPTSFRSLAMCTMFMVGQLGAAVGGNMLIFCLNRVMCIVVFASTSVLILTSACCFHFLWPDPALVRQQMEEKHFTY